MTARTPIAVAAFTLAATVTTLAYARPPVPPPPATETRPPLPTLVTITADQTVAPAGCEITLTLAAKVGAHPAPDGSAIGIGYRVNGDPYVFSETVVTTTDGSGRAYVTALSPLDTPVEFVARYPDINGGALSESVSLTWTLPPGCPVIARRLVRAETGEAA